MVTGDHTGRHGASTDSENANSRSNRQEDAELVVLAERWKAAFRALVDFQRHVGHASRPCHSWDATTLEALDRLVEAEREAHEMLDGFLVGSFREPPPESGRE